MSFLATDPVASAQRRESFRPGPRRLEDPLVLFERYRRERRPEDRNALVVRYMALAQHLARRYSTRAEEDDLQQVAALGLVKAIDRFDPSRGIAFSSFAVPTILGELKRYFRDLGWAVRPPRDIQELTLRVDVVAERLTGELGRSQTVDEVARACQATAEDVLEARAASSAHYPVSLDQPAHEEDDEVRERLVADEDPGFARAEQAADLERLFSCLNEREREVVRLRFGEDLVQQEIGARLGISQMHVSRLLRQAIATLQQHAGSR